MVGKIERLLQEHPFMMDILNSLPEAFYICDENDRPVFINKAAEKLDGFTLDEVYGETTEYIYGLKNDESPLLSAFTTKKEVKDFVFRYNVNGKKIIQLCNAAPIFVEGEFAGVYTIQRDLSDMNHMIEHNIDLQKQLFTAEKKSPNNHENHETTLLGNDPQFVECRNMALRASETDSTVMLIADTGCGKEMFARYIHNNSKRNQGPFLALNCAAIPENLLESLLFGTAKGAYTGAVEREGLFEQAEGGTLFLDEINSMPLSSQSKLLRVVEDGIVKHLGSSKEIKTDVRIISSCNIQAQDAIENKQLRPDLFYRLAVISLSIPPLSQRKDDIYTLANHFISVYNQSFGKHIMGLSDDIVPFFLSYHWPGNVRQLKHCIESAMNFVTENDYYIKKKHLPPYIFHEIDEHFTGYRRKGDDFAKARKPMAITKDTGHEVLFGRRESDDTPSEMSVFETIRQNEKEEIIHALLDCKGNVTQAEKKLHIGRNALIYRIKKYNIK